jgi:hypothetical protein
MNNLRWIALFALLVQACTSNQHAGTGIETTSLTASIKMSNGTPAAHLRVLVYSDTLAAADTLYTDSQGVLQTPASMKSPWIYAGGVTEGAWTKLNETNQTVTLAPLQMVTLKFDSTQAPDSLLVTFPPLAASQTSLGTWVIQGVPAGEIHTQVLAATTYSLNYKIDSVPAKPQLLDTPQTVALPVTPATAKYSCGIANPLDMQALASSFCYYDKMDTTNLAQKSSWAFQSIDSISLNIEIADTAKASSLVAFALRFGGGSSVDLRRVQALRIQANIPNGEKFKVIAITFDGVSTYNYYSVNLTGQGSAWYTAVIDSLIPMHPLPALDKTIGFDVQFNTPGDTLQPVLYQVESVPLS